MAEKSADTQQIAAEAMQKLTVSQQKYLFTLYRLQITDVKQSDLAEEAGVSRPAINRVMQELMDMGLVVQRKQRKICLSERGERIAEALDDQLTAIVQYLAADMDMDETVAMRQSLDIALNMQPDYRAACLRKIDKQQCRKPLPQDGSVKLQDVLQPGTYRVPFQLLHLREDKTSMGDAGFTHPCTLELTAAGGALYLPLCDLKCVSQAGRALTGRLKTLYYNAGNDWQEADVSDTECRIPTEYMALTLDNHGTLRTGELQVKVRASVGPFAMPESCARLKFNFRTCKKLK